MKKKIELEEHNFANENDVNQNGSLLNPITIHTCSCGFFCDHMQKQKLDKCPDCGGTDFEEINE